MARKVHVEGTKKFLMWALVLLAVGIWAIMDGWFPSDAMLLKHPLDKDTNFYLFNKSLAVLCLIGSAIYGYIHAVVK